ncbi:hypothetical protein ACO0QE_001644 [Hanseniaspora vineae]
MPQNKVSALIQYIFISLALIAAVEYFKFGTRQNYEWFHCTPVYESLNISTSSTTTGDSSPSTAKKLYAVGGPSCDKRGEFKTLVKRITRDYDINKQRISFCIVEAPEVSYRHYPVEDGNKGAAGYVAYIAEDNDLPGLLEIEKLCKDTSIYHI